MSSENVLLPIRKVRERYGNVSHMWIERRLTGDPTFPRPVYIGRLRFWRQSELAEWELTLTKASPVKRIVARDQGAAA